jgi:signal transduction histidine kinase
MWSGLKSVSAALHEPRRRTARRAVPAPLSLVVKRRVQFSLFVLLLLLFAMTGTGIFASYALYRSAEDHYIGLALPVRAATRDVLYQMEREESGVRGYVITGDRASLNTYFSGRRGVERDLRRLSLLARSPPEMNDELASVRRRVVSLHGFYDRLVVFVADGTLGTKRARAEVLQGADRAARFHAAAASLQSAADRLVQRTRHDQRLALVRTLVIMSVAGALAIAIALILLVMLPNRLRRLYAREEEARREAEEGANAARALEHVSEAVALVDEEGKIRFWNRKAEELFHVEAARAIGDRAGLAIPEFERLVAAAERSERFVPVRINGDDRWVTPSVTTFEGGSVLAVSDATTGYVLERTRADFVATASHELRTPLTSVFGGVRTLIAHRDVLPRGQQDRLLRMIEQEAVHLVEIVDQLLVSAQLDRGALNVGVKVVDISELCRSVVESARLRALDRNPVLLQMPSQPVLAETDEVLLRQVLVNLLENAIKYSSRSGRVEVLVSQKADVAQIDVVDEGIGIPPAELQRIFEKFYRLDVEMDRGVGGSGLGLYISKEIMERVHGTLTVSSVPGEGSTFTVTLPRGNVEREA